mgnify:CR=1 FL=1
MLKEVLTVSALIAVVLLVRAIFKNRVRILENSASKAPPASASSLHLYSRSVTLISPPKRFPGAETTT